MRKLLWSFSDAGMKLAYLIFCDDTVLKDKKNNNKKKKKKKTKTKKKKKNKQTKKKNRYNVLSTDREVLIKAKHGC